MSGVSPSRDNFMSFKRARIFTNGILNESSLSEIDSDDYVIGVDKAAHWLLIHGIIPNVAVGDFDSTSKEEFEQIKKDVRDIRTFPAEKDFVDTELALSVALEKQVDEIALYGGSGSRLDHTFATLSLLEKGIQSNVPIYFTNETNEIRLLSRCRTIVKKRGDFKYISVIPYSQKIIVSLEALKYPLDHATIHRGQTIGVSNEFLTDSAIITVHTGMAFVIQSKD